jgi:hypothetical protein
MELNEIKALKTGPLKDLWSVVFLLENQQHFEKRQGVLATWYASLRAPNRSRT